jgi:4-diphosphocytidyl-2C-methyl-D-erythritol kinase
MIPFACGMGLCLNNCPTHKRWVYVFPHTHKIETKRIIKITNPENNIEKTKRKERRKPTIKKELNNIFKNYKKKRQNKDKQQNLKKKEREKYIYI